MTCVCQSPLGRADVLKGRSATAYPACGPEVILAGGNFVELSPDDVHIDGTLVRGTAEHGAHVAWF